MSKRFVIFLVFIAVLLVVVFTFNNNKSNRKTIISESGNQKPRIENWYGVAESQDFKIFDSGLRGGHIVVVLDKKSGELLVPAESCEITIPNEMKNLPDTYFLNDTIGIKLIGAYKEINFKEGSRNTFTQNVLNSGCYHKEGEITLIQSEKSAEIDCEIEIKYEHLGC